MRLLTRLLACAAAVAMSTSSASALTLYQLSGSGALDLDVDGSITLDLGGNAFDAITLAAVSSVSVDNGGAAPAPDAVVTLTDLDGFAGSFDEDVSVEILSWSGTLDVSASDSISVIGPLATTDPEADPCAVGGGIVISAGGLPPGVDPCDGLVVVGPPDGGGIVVDGGITPSNAIPEPAAALVFGVGLLLLRARDGLRR